MIVFKYYHGHRAGFEDEVREWVISNWDKWESEKPDWWTDIQKSLIPDDMLSAAALESEKKRGGGQRRRSSIRDSFRLVVDPE